MSLLRWDILLIPSCKDLRTVQGGRYRGQSGLRLFLHCYPRNRAHEQTGPVIRGYLALLLARAVLSQPDGQEIVRQIWEYSDTDQVRAELIGALGSLRALHRQAGQQFEGEDGGESERIVSDTIEQLSALY